MKNTDFYKYGITNELHKVIDGADTLKEAKEIVSRLKKEEPNAEFHIYLLDDDGFIKTWVDRG